MTRTRLDGGRNWWDEVQELGWLTWRVAWYRSVPTVELIGDGWNPVGRLPQNWWFI